MSPLPLFITVVNNLQVPTTMVPHKRSAAEHLKSFESIRNKVDEVTVVIILCSIEVDSLPDFSLFIYPQSQSRHIHSYISLSCNLFWQLRELAREESERIENMKVEKNVREKRGVRYNFNFPEGTTITYIEK